MADNPTTPALVSMAQQFTGLPMKSLISVPLMAAAKANALMARTQVKFMLDTCFTTSKSLLDDEAADGTNPPEHLEPIMISFKMTNAEVTSTGTPPDVTDKLESQSVTFELPLLTIIPLNSLAVTAVDVDFDMEVKSSYSQDSSEEVEKKVAASGSWDAKLGWGIFGAEIKGNASYSNTTTDKQSTHYQKSNSAHYHVAVTAGQLPLPQGVLTIIQAYTNAIHVPPPK